MKKRFSIKRYLKASVLIWVLLVSLVTTVWMYFDAIHEIDEIFDASLVESARILDDLLYVHPPEEASNQSTHTPSKLNKQITAKAVNGGHEYEKKVAFQVWSKDDILLYKSDSAPRMRFTVSETGFHRIEIHGHQWQAFSLYSEQNQWWLLVAESDEIRNELAGRIVQNHIFPLIIGIPFLLLALHFLINKGLRPLQNIASQLAGKHHRDLSPIDQEKTPEEVLDLVNSLNGLFQKLDNSYQRESHFSTDAAHELRNPLAALMINTDNALEDVIRIQDHDLTEKKIEVEAHLKQQVIDLGNIKSGIKQLSHTVQQLLALSRAENQITDENTREFLLAQLVSKVAQELSDQRENKKQTLQISISPDHKIQGDEGLFSLLLSNLLSNTIKYSGYNSETYISTIMHENGTLELIYEDNGPGMAANEVVRAKDRFYRSINVNREESGSGLGLSIVDAIVKKYEGTWELSQSDKGGLKASILLPNS